MAFLDSFAENDKHNYVPNEVEISGTWIICRLSVFYYTFAQHICKHTHITFHTAGEGSRK